MSRISSSFSPSLGSKFMIKSTLYFFRKIPSHKCSRSDKKLLYLLFMNSEKKEDFWLLSTSKKTGLPFVGTLFMIYFFPFYKNSIQKLSIFGTVDDQNWVNMTLFELLEVFQGCSGSFPAKCFLNWCLIPKIKQVFVAFRIVYERVHVP